MREIRLIATDLDGTLLGSSEDFPLLPRFHEKLNTYRRDYNAAWVVCTGRSLNSFRHMFAPLRMLGITPDYVIVRHAYIYSIRGTRYRPHRMWNLSTRYRLYLEPRQVRQTLQIWHQLVRQASGGFRILRQTSDRLWLRFQKENAALQAMQVLLPHQADCQHLRLFKYYKEIDIRFVPFTKGIALSELSRHLEVSPEQVLAIGNGHNDISMLDGTYAHATGCPGNADDSIKKVVHESGGHIARAATLPGVMEVLDAWREDCVDSRLPEGWQDPVMSQSPGPRYRSDAMDGRQTVKLRRVLLVLLIGYVVLLAFASQGMIPFVSGLIMRPFEMAISLLRYLPGMA